VADSLAALARAGDRPATSGSGGSAAVGGTGGVVIAGAHEVPIDPATPEPKPVSRSTTPPASRTPTTPAKPVSPTPARVADVTPVVTPASKDPETPREPDAGGSSRHLQDLAERCVAAIASNNASSAGRQLRGDVGGLMSAINDGRIVSASSGGVDVNGSEARFSVRIAWRTAFGGNKSSVAHLSADASRSGCAVESSGGVR
jgi:hypothetical protein